MALYREVLASRRATLGSQHPHTYTTMCNLGGLLEVQGKLREAEVLYSEALMGRFRVLGRAHSDTQATCTALVRTLTAQGKARDAREVKAQYGGLK